ncbi:MAG: TAXI family TRAP transporter solute-binding subunit [SAR324 cluster bacterium]|nr:TAXI family TRAP transporter solute-binding subunit [SAR324 cluster bacterium]
MIRISKALLILIAIAFFSFQVSAETFVRIASGPAGGSWYPLGAKIAEVLGSNVKDISTSNGPGGGVGNVKDVHKGESEIGWTYGHTAYDGYAGKEGFKTKHTNIRHLATLYPAGLQTAVLAKSNIKSYSELKDKNISPGKAQWSGYAAYKMIIGHYGYTIEDVKKNGGTVHHVSYNDSVGLMKDGHIDAFGALTSVPQASYLNLEFNPGIRFLPVSDEVLSKILSSNPGYIRTEINNGHYKSIKEPVQTLGAVTIMVINKDLPEDIVYNITKTLWENHAEFAKVKKVWNSVKLENALLGAATPVHPGAKRYYDEMGVK